MGLRVTEDMTGMKELNAALFRLSGPELQLAVEQGLFQVGSEIEGDAKELVPVDTGSLRDSGFTITRSLEALGPRAEVDPGTRADVEPENESLITAVVGFGGPAQEYAIVQHERLDFHHRVGQAKYLETAVNQHVEDIAPMIAEKVQAMIEGRSAGGSGAGSEGSGFE